MPIKIENRIGIAAPAEVIWEVMAEVSRWPEWAAIYSRAAGEVRYGGVLNFTLALPDRSPRAFVAPILDWTPNEAIHWKTKGFMMETVRFLEIEKYSDTGCAFSNGEIFSGYAVRYIPRSHLRALRHGFAALGGGLKERAEGLWRQRSGEAKLAV